MGIFDKRTRVGFSLRLVAKKNIQLLQQKPRTCAAETQGRYTLMIKIVIASEKYPIDNILIHIRVFLKKGNSYGNISNLKTDEYGSIILTKKLIEENLVSADIKNITGFGLSFLNLKTIEQLKQTYKRYETIDISEIEAELGKKGFKESKLKTIARNTLSELRKQSEMYSFYEASNNHLVPSLDFENEFKFDFTTSKIILNLESVLYL
ncbi:MAG: hypothetical protein JJ895_09315 [Balneolaceae bacterium]|nr:hypothetical protein [Balneolaceae bacterium]